MQHVVEAALLKLNRTPTGAGSSSGASDTSTPTPLRRRCENVSMNVTPLECIITSSPAEVVVLDKIGVETELVMHFQAKTTRRAREKLRKTLRTWSHCVLEEKFRDALNKKMREECPEVDFVTEGSAGVGIKCAREAMEKLLKLPFWRNKIRIDEAKHKKLLWRVSADGTEQGEMFAHSLEIVGVTCVNLEIEYLQNFHFYIPVAAIPMVESKSTMERNLLKLYTSFDKCTKISIPGGHSYTNIVMIYHLSSSPHQLVHIWS